jgi:serine/threonine-protein kinase
MSDAASSEDEQDASSMVPPGTVLAGKYRIDALIGKGGMGSVWSAVHLGLGQRVAVKLISRRYAASREARHRFDLEAKAVAQLRSRHVVQVYDNGETGDGTPFIVMEYLDGESLDRCLQRMGRIPLSEAVRIVTQVGRALSRAHGLGIIHRDLKPENIFLARSQDEDETVAKVLDFGIAKIKNPETGDSGTRTGAVLGTPLFMSPEQARGLKTVDHRTDVYSLGMVVYTMVTGQTAFSGESFGDILLAICTKPLPPVRELAPWLPPAFDGWLARACAREPGDRYRSIDELVDALCSVAGLKTLPLSREQASSAMSAPLPTVQDSGVRSPSAALATQASPPAGYRGTTSAVELSDAGLPKRSLAPFAVIGGLLLLGGGALAVFFARKGGTGIAAGASQDTVALQAIPSSTPSPTASASAPTVDLRPVDTLPREGAAPDAPKQPSQKASTSPKPSGKLGEAAKPAAKTEPKGTGGKPKSSGGTVDLGF